MKNKKSWDMIGIILGIVILILGIVFMVSPPDTYKTNSADSASFGGDYYTYQYEATKIVAGNTAVTANNLREMGETQAKQFGVLLMVIGALTFVNYGKKYFTENVTEAVPAAVTPVVTIPAAPVAVAAEVVAQEAVTPEPEADVPAQEA